MKFSSFWNFFAGRKALKPIFNLRIPIIKELGKFKSGDAVLDFGSGTGRVGEAIRPLVRHIVMADADLNMLAQARALGFEAVAVTGLPLPFPDASFDAILVIETLHHLPDHEAHVREFARILKPGGRIVIQEPNPLSLLRFFFWVERLFEPVVYHAPGKMRAMFDRHGFEVDREERVGFSYFLRAVKR